mgnify:CR=1 FL=1
MHFMVLFMDVTLYKLSFEKVHHEIKIISMIYKMLSNGSGAIDTYVGHKDKICSICEHILTKKMSPEVQVSHHNG